MSSCVYGSRDSQNRIHHRISKETPTGEVISGAINLHVTAARHEDVDYPPRFQEMTRGEVDRLIFPMLAATQAPWPFGMANRERYMPAGDSNIFPTIDLSKCNYRPTLLGV